MQMDFSELAADVTRVALDGRLDAAGSGAIELQLTAQVAPAERHVVLDLAAVPFVSSLGIRLLLTLARTLRRRGRTLVIANVQPAVMTVFETVALGTLIPIAADEAEALSLVRA
jgi:anti-anti-sigma factor